MLQLYFVAKKWVRPGGTLLEVRTPRCDPGVRTSRCVPAYSGANPARRFFIGEKMRNPRLARVSWVLLEVLVRTANLGANPISSCYAIEILRWGPPHGILARKDPSDFRMTPHQFVPARLPDRDSFLHSLHVRLAGIIARNFRNVAQRKPRKTSALPHVSACLGNFYQLAVTPSAMHGKLPADFPFKRAATIPSARCQRRHAVVRSQPKRLQMSLHSYCLARIQIR